MGWNLDDDFDDSPASPMTNQPANQPAGQSNNAFAPIVQPVKANVQPMGNTMNNDADDNWNDEEPTHTQGQKPRKVKTIISGGKASNQTEPRDAMPMAKIALILTSLMPPVALILGIIAWRKYNKEPYTYNARSKDYAQFATVWAGIATLSMISILMFIGSIFALFGQFATATNSNVSISTYGSSDTSSSEIQLPGTLGSGELKEETSDKDYSDAETMESTPDDHVVTDPLPIDESNDETSGNNSNNRNTSENESFGQLEHIGDDTTES